MKIIRTCEDNAATVIALTAIITTFLREREAAHYLFHKKCSLCAKALQKAETLLKIRVERGADRRIGTRRAADENKEVKRQSNPR